MQSQKPRLGECVKIFDPNDPDTGTTGSDLVDATVVRRDEQWWMYLAGQASERGATNLYSASLPVGAPLSALGWKVSRNEAGGLAPIAGGESSKVWDGNGGRHCPSYVNAWDPAKRECVERIYYASSAENLWGPYSIGFLQWNGEIWEDQSEPAFAANEEWEHGSVYEPNLIYHDGKWKMWYVAGSNHENYLVQGYAESEDGCRSWSKHLIFAPQEMKMFDFCVRQRGAEFHAIFSRVWFGTDTPRAETGLWWCKSGAPSSDLSKWTKPVQIMTAEDRGWHSGPWKPSFQFEGELGGRALVFFDGLYRTSDAGPFPFAFTLGCVKVDLPTI